MNENEIAKVVVDAAFKIHKQVGPGLLESAYQAFLVYELKKEVCLLNLRYRCQSNMTGFK